MRINSINSNGVKDRKRYEINNFRGVDTSTAPNEVSPNRATYLRNLEDRNGSIHKRFGWKEDLKQKLSLENITIYDTFKATLNGIDYDFIHYNNVIAVYSNNELVTSFTGVSKKEGFGYYSNQKVYYFGIGEPLCIYNKDGSIVIESLIDNKELTYIPTIRTSIGYLGKENDQQEVLDDYNLMTHYVKYKFEGIAQQTSIVTYKLPIKDKQIDTDFNLEIERMNADRTTETITLTKGEKTGSNVFEEGIAESNLGIRKYVTYTYGGAYKSVSLTIKRVNVTSNDSEIYNHFTNLQEMGKTLYLYKFSNGYNIGFQLSNDGSYWGVYLLDSNDNIVTNQLLAQVRIGTNQVTFAANETTIELPSEFTNLGTSFCTFDLSRSKEWANNFTIVGTFPILTSVSAYELKYYSTVVGNISFEGGYFQINKDFNITPPISNASNITLTTKDIYYNPKYDLTNIKISTLFGADGRCDRVFASITDNPNIVLWSDFDENTYIENPFTYWQESSWVNIGANQSKVNGMTRLNDSTLAVFREKILNENNFSILTAAYVSVDKYVINNETYDIPALKVSVASANMPQTAVNNNCFGALASDVIFASENGVYAVSISTGTSVERYALERSDTISNIFPKLDMVNAKAIVYKNKYYLAAQSKDKTENLVLVADAKYSYKLARNMRDTFNYEWYIWDNCPIKKWVIENEKLGFFDYEGRKCFFEEDNYIDTKYDYTNLAITTSSVGNRYLVSPELVYKEFVVLSGLENQYTNEVINDAYDKVFQIDKDGYLILVNGDDYIYNTAYRINTTDEKIALVKSKKVSAVWVSASMDLGASDFRKTIFLMTLGVGETTSGKFEFGYQTKEFPNKIIDSTIAAKSFMAEDYNMHSLSLGQSFNFSVTSKAKIRDFTYIQFIFRSDVGEDMSISNITILYKYNKFNRGVK